jgi:hypothetical protein
VLNEGTPGLSVGIAINPHGPYPDFDLPVAFGSDCNSSLM